MSVVSLFVSVSKEAMVGNERRFDKGLTIFDVKKKLELIVGTPPAFMKLQLYDANDRILGDIDDNDRLLGSYPVEDYMRIHVIDTNPSRRAGEFSDVSVVPKYEMPDEEYAKRADSVRAFKERNKLGQFAQQNQDLIKKDETGIDNFALNQRCETKVGNLTAKGTIKFIGQTKFAPGNWIGIQLDEPVGKNNGSVQEVQYFSCLDKYGVFVRPEAVTVGDFPEEDFEM